LKPSAFFGRLLTGSLTLTRHKGKAAVGPMQ
jgi:hypothetical protein